MNTVGEREREREKKERKDILTSFKKAKMAYKTKQEIMSEVLSRLWEQQIKKNK